MIWCACLEEGGERASEIISYFKQSKDVLSKLGAVVLLVLISEIDGKSVKIGKGQSREREREREREGGRELYKWQTMNTV